MTKTRLFLILAFILSLRVANHTDLWWDLAVGRHIWIAKSIPYYDFFSFSAPNYPYVYYSWLPELVLFLIHSRLGLWGVSLFYSIFSALGVWFIAQTARLRLKTSWFYFILLFFIPLFSWYVQFRTQVFTFVGLTMLYYIFNLPPHKLSQKALFIPLLFILWVNLHGGFIQGLLFLFVLTLVKILYLARSSSLVFTKKRHSIIMLLSVLFLSSLGALVNPYGARAYWQAILIGTDRFRMQLNLDWVPLFSSKVAVAIPENLIAEGWIYVLLLIVLLWGKKIDWQDKVLVGLFFFLSLRTRRFVLPLLIVLMPSILTQLEYIYERFIAKSKLQKDYNLFPVYLALIAIIVAVFGGAIQTVRLMYRVYSSEELYASLDYPRFSYPYGAAAHMKKGGVPAWMFNYLEWGGYLTWHFPHDKIFIDGRIENYFVNRKSLAVDYLNIAMLLPGWRELMAKYKINAVLGPPHWPIVDFLKMDSSWEVVYEDEVSVIIVGHI